MTVRGRRPVRHRACLVACGAWLLWPALAACAQPQPIVVELYTSQGCSSCPPADQLLGELQARDDVVALSFHVDYWDYLGWRDTLASGENSQRQRAYERVLPAGSVYTPQLVIDGVRHAIGSQRRRALELIARRLDESRDRRVPVTITASADTLRVHVGAGPAPGRPAEIWLAHTLSERTVDIDRGENRGRTLAYHNVVRSFSVIGVWSGQPLELDVPAGRRQHGITDGVAVWVQVRQLGPILGAAHTRIAGH
jgi:hypothetical protein